jgi:predicted TIM-barrel fold metal-dependent hydrolase
VGYRDPDVDQVSEPAPDDLGVVTEAVTREPVALHAHGGPKKVIFASDWPVLRQRRVIPEATALDLPPDVLDNYLFNNANEFFFREQ